MALNFSTAELARLGIVVDASGVLKAVDATDRLTASGKRTEQQSTRVTESIKRVTDSTRSMTLMQMRAIEMDRQLAGSKNVLASATRGLVSTHVAAGVGISALRGPLTTLTSQLTGVNNATSTVISMLGALAVGSGVMVSALFGLAALAKAWELITRRSREAKTAAEEAIKAVDEANRQRTLGPAGELPGQLDTLQTDLARLNRERATIKSLGEAAEADQNGFEMLRQARRLRLKDAEITAMNTRIRAGLDTERSILVGHNKDIAKDRAAALEKELADQKRAQDAALRILNIHLSKIKAMKAASVAADDEARRKIGGGSMATIGMPGVGDIQKVSSVRADAAAARRASEESVRQFNETMQAVREVSSAFGDLTHALVDLGPVLRGVESIMIGIARAMAAEQLTGSQRSLAQASGALSIGAGTMQVGQAAGGLSRNRAAGAGIGAATGAASGALLGTYVFPGFGTAVGAVVGGLAGLVGGFMGASKAAQKFQEAMRQANQFMGDVEVRALQARGFEREAAAMAVRLAHEREMIEAQKAGLSATMLARLREVQALEQAKVALKELADVTRLASANIPDIASINLWRSRVGGTAEIPPPKPPFIPWKPGDPHKPGLPGNPWPAASNTTIVIQGDFVSKAENGRAAFEDIRRFAIQDKRSGGVGLAQAV